jgi:hypothetical protein
MTQRRTWWAVSVACAWSAAVGTAGAQSTTTRVSLDANSNQVGLWSRQPSASADGRLVAFSATAFALVPGDTNASADVFVKDRQTAAVTRVSVRTDGTQQTGESVTPDMSSDGRYVAFASAAALVADDTNTCAGAAGPTCGDIYVHDRTTGTTTRVSVATGGAQADGPSALPRISGDGRYVVFESAATNLVAGDTNGVVDVFLHDRQTGTTGRVSVSTGGTQADRAATAPTISDDGARIVFVSDATTLDAGPDTLPCDPTVLACTRAFLRSGAAVTRVGITVTPIPSTVVAQAYRVSSAVISGDGETVGLLVQAHTPVGPFMGSIDNVVSHALSSGRTNGLLAIYPYPVTEPVPVRPSRWSSLSIDRGGRTLAACYYGLSAAGNTFGVYVRDHVTGLGALVAGPPDFGGYLPAQPDCEGVALTDSGTLMFFASSGSKIADGDTNESMDVFAHDRDTDRDGMPSEWESRFRLDPAVDDGATDQDHDGQTAVQEFQAATHPYGVFRYYLAEGAANAIFSTHIDIYNPDLTTGANAIQVVAQFFGQNGRRSPGPVTTIGYSASSTATLDSSREPWRFPDQAFSTLVESDRPVAVERTLSWGGPLGDGYGAHAEAASAGPATTAYFAEGATHGPFDLFYLLQNPSGEAATATVTYLRPAPLPPIVRAYALLPNSRLTIWVDQEADLSATDVSAQIVADRPILAERSMYMSTPGQPFAGGTASAGIVAPATQWFVAEGATGAFFDLYLLVGNPSSDAADVTVTYLLPDGTSIARAHQVAAQSRLTISVKGEDARLAATAVSASIASTDGTPIVVERSMWWPSPHWYEGAVTAGTTAAARRWALAGGYLDRRRPDTQTYLLVANPNSTPANVTFDLGLWGRAPQSVVPTSEACRVTVPVPGHGRYTIALADACPFSTSTPGPMHIAGTIESDGPSIVVERSTYWSAGGQFWAAGASTVLTPLP